MKIFYDYDENIWPDFGRESYGIIFPDPLGPIPKENRQVICLWDENRGRKDKYTHYILGEVQYGERIEDVKDMNEDIYRAYTGKTNTDVIYNLTDLVKRIPSEKLVCRVPLIKGFNTEEDVGKSVMKLKEIGVENIERFSYKCP